MLVISCKLVFAMIPLYTSDNTASLSGVSILLENSSAVRGVNDRYCFLNTGGSMVSISLLPMIGLTAVSE